LDSLHLLAEANDSSLEIAKKDKGKQPQQRNAIITKPKKRHFFRAFYLFEILIELHQVVLHGLEQEG
jgi:hypothetical protein